MPNEQFFSYIITFNEMMMVSLCTRPTCSIGFL